MFWLLLFALSLSKLKYLVCFHCKGKSLIKMASSSKSTEYQAKEKTKKTQTPTIPPNPHVHSLIEINVLWECKSKYVKNVTRNYIVRFLALGGKAACGVSGRHEMNCFKTCPLPVKSRQFVTLDSIIHCRGEKVGQ